MPASRSPWLAVALCLEGRGLDRDGTDWRVLGRRGAGVGGGLFRWG